MKLLYSMAASACLLATPALSAVEFEAPTILKGGDKVMLSESPGYAAPCLADVDGDGVRDMLVGQFRGGKIALYKGIKTEDGSLKFAAQTWLQADGKDATVPGVW